MHIDLGAIFSKIFGKKKKYELKGSFEAEALTADAVWNCCDQLGTFEKLKINDETEQKKISEEVVTIFNGGNQTYERLFDSLVEGFNKSGYVVGNKMANDFVFCYLDGYVNQN